jgi:hypothetical protein
MENLHENDYIEFQEKRHKLRFGKVISSQSRELYVVVLEFPEKISNHHIKFFFPKELVQIGTRVKIDVESVLRKIKVLSFSEYIAQFFNNDEVKINVEKLEESGAFVNRFSVTGPYIKDITNLGQSKEFCSCGNVNMNEQEVYQCQNCRKIFHVDCFKRSFRKCQCEEVDNFIPLKKREQIDEYDFNTDLLPEVPDNATSNRNPGSQYQSKHKPAVISLPSSQKKVSLGKLPIEQPQDSLDTKKNLEKVTAIYKKNYALERRTPLEEYRAKIKENFFAIFANFLLEIKRKSAGSQLADAVKKLVTSFLSFDNTQITDYAANFAAALEELLLKMDRDPMNKNSVYYKKSRLYSLILKRDSSEEILAQLLSRALPLEKFVQFEEDDLTDQKLKKFYEEEFWRSRAINEEKIVLKNDKVI